MGVKKKKKIKYLKKILLISYYYTSCSTGIDSPATAGERVIIIPFSHPNAEKKPILSSGRRGREWPRVIIRTLCIQGVFIHGLNDTTL